MKNYPAAIMDALAAGALVPRDFLWIEPRNRSTGARMSWGAWSDLGTVSAQVNDPVSGVVSRSFEGAGSLVAVDDVSMVAGLVVQTLSIQLSGIAAESEALIRGADVRLAPVSLFRGYLSPETMRLAAPAQAVFLGFVDQVSLTTPEEGGESAIALTCANHVQELTRKGTATRSDADQRQRDAGDAFFSHAATVGTWQIKWQPKE